jgi:hypothetical protein
MHNFYGIRAKTDSFRKGYITDAYDQPTFLSFALDFRFEGTSTSVRDLLWSSPLFEKGGSDNFYSAQTYLGSIGHKDKETNLQQFKSILEYLTLNAPWYFQEITGLDSLWKGATDMKGANKSKDAVLTINTLEAIDLRIAEIANLYRTSIYDKQSMRERVPDNLRWFSVDIYIAEARNIRYTPLQSASGITGALGINTGGINRIATGITSALGTFSPELDLGSPMKQFGFIKFKCRQCEFDFSDSFPGGNQLSVGLDSNAKPAQGKFKIKVGYFEEESEYQDSVKLSDSAESSSKRNPWSSRNTTSNLQNMVKGATFLPGIGEGIGNALDKGSEKLKSIGGLVNPALNAAFSKTSYPYLGKIY